MPRQGGPSVAAYYDLPSMISVSTSSQISSASSGRKINWIDPMPDEESSVYEAYAQESQSIEQEIDFYK